MSKRSGRQPLVVEAIIAGFRRKRKTAVELIIDKGELRLTLPRKHKSAVQLVPRNLAEMNLYYKSDQLQVVCPFCAQHRRAEGLLYWDQCTKCGAYLYFGFAAGYFACFALGKFEAPAQEVLGWKAPRS